MKSSFPERTDSVRIAGVLAEIARLLESPDDEDERLRRVLKALGHLVNYQSCALLIEASNKADLFTAPDLPANRRSALQSHLSSLLSAIKGHSETAASPVEANRLVLPIIGADRIVGLLHLEGAQAYELDDVQLLTAVASQLGTYLTMVELTARERATREETERLNEALRKAHDLLADKAKLLERLVEERTVELRHTIAELEAFSYSLSHDMRAPLRAIQSYSGIVLDMQGQEMGPQEAEYLKRAISAAQRLDRLIQDVLAFSGLSRKEVPLGPVDVDKLVRAIIQERPDWQPPRIEVNIEAPLLPMMGHDASLTQCITNLLDNAVKFVAPGAKPRVRIWSASVPQSSVKLFIEDKGIGIEKQAQNRLFQIFERIHGGDYYEGTGVGLAIVRKAVARMKGRIGVESEPGEGTRFWIELPSPSQ